MYTTVPFISRHMKCEVHVFLMTVFPLGFELNICSVSMAGAGNELDPFEYKSCMLHLDLCDGTEVDVLELCLCNPDVCSSIF
jgi:hypothetical protein